MLPYSLQGLATRWLALPSGAGFPPAGLHDLARPHFYSDPLSHKSLARRRLGQIGVLPLAGDHQRGEDGNTPAAIVPEGPGEDLLRLLRLEGEVALRAVGVRGNNEMTIIINQ
jgi:hypothetical protein